MAAQALDTFKEGRKVALKMDRLLDPKTVEREAKVLKRLQPCPCVVRLLEQGSHEQRGFMIMEVGKHACMPAQRCNACCTQTVSAGRNTREQLRVVNRAPAAMPLQLLGMNVADSRKSCAKDGIWDAHTARSIGLHLLSAITGRRI